MQQVHIKGRGVSPHLRVPPFSPSCGQQVCQVPNDLSQMLLLVFGEVHQIPQQECLHHGESVWDPEPTHQLLLAGRRPHSHPGGLILLPSILPPDCHLWHQLLHLSQERLFPAHEKHYQVREHTIALLPSSPGPRASIHTGSLPVPAEWPSWTKLRTSSSYWANSWLWVVWVSVAHPACGAAASSRRLLGWVESSWGCYFLELELTTISVSNPSPGILAFFFFTHRIRIVQDTAPPLNYYWVPILVWTFGYGQRRGEKVLGLTWSPLTGQMWAVRSRGLVV